MFSLTGSMRGYVFLGLCVKRKPLLFMKTEFPLSGDDVEAGGTVYAVP
jgi:hypothetical protein